MKKGKVWLVGAGPGDSGLITLKGHAVLSDADVVVYDRLVGEGVLAMISDAAEKIPVGKQAGFHSVKQPEINRILLEQGLAGKKVVRLKGGDPFLFGRGGEELELLIQHKVPYEIVPGVTSALAVPAYNGIPVTHREFSSSVHIITGHKKSDLEYDVDFDALVKLNGTLLFLMGFMALEQICERLMAAGMVPVTPAAVLQQGTTAGQKRVVATVATLKDEVRKQQIESPAILLFGEVASLSERFEWYEKLPLFGRRVLLPVRQGNRSKMAQQLREQGAEVLELPVLFRTQIGNQKAIRAMLGQREQGSWLFFTDPGAVESFFNQLRNERIDIREMMGIRLAGYGTMTGRELEQRSLWPDRTYFHHEQISDVLEDFCAAASLQKVYVICSENKNEQLIRSILERTASEKIVICRDQYLGGNRRDYHAEYLILTSKAMVQGLIAEMKQPYSGIALCIGERTEQAARQAGMKTIRPVRSGIEDVISLLAEQSGHR